jgi:hypothetical protein
MADARSHLFYRRAEGRFRESARSSRPGNFTVPIALLPGRNGFKPEINLVYSTGNGNGPVGLRWALSIPGVSRRTAKGVPPYNDATDVFLLSGSEDLVPIALVLGLSAKKSPGTRGGTHSQA